MVRTSSWNCYSNKGSGNPLLFGAVHPILQLHDIEVLVWGEHALLVVVELETGVLDLLDKLLLLLVALGQTSQNLPHRGYRQRCHPSQGNNMEWIQSPNKIACKHPECCSRPPPSPRAWPDWDIPDFFLQPTTPPLLRLDPGQPLHWRFCPSRCLGAWAGKPPTAHARIAFLAKGSSKS